MNPFIIFDVSGIDGIAVNGECRAFSIERHENITSIEILQDDLCIVGIKVFFASDITIDSSIIDSTRQSVELFITNIIGHLDAVVTEFSVRTGDIYNPNEQPKDGPLIINDMILMVDTLSVTVSYPIQRYAGLFLNSSIDLRKKDRFTIFGNIMKIENIAVRYLMQYEFLLSLISQNRKQKDVTDFIKNQFNTSSVPTKVGFHKTRRPGKNFDEDDITYYRNILAHNDSSAIPENFDRTISVMSKALTNVIFFYLDQT